MKVCDLISKILDSYVDIVINEYKGTKRTGRAYLIKKHSTDCTHIPEDIWNLEINMIVPYCDRISIDIVKE